MKIFNNLTILFALLGSLSIYAQSWDLLTPLKSGDIVSGVSFLNEEEGYAVIQASGTVLHTIDGGVTWNMPWTPGISSNLYDVEFVSPDTIFTCGNSGEIFRSIDSGNSWIEMATPTNEFLYALEFVSPQLGFASGFNGVLLRTQNGGDDWEVLTTNTTNRLMDVKFRNELLGYSCGWNGTIIKTTDGGDTWSEVPSGVTISLFELSLPSENVVYSCGWNNTIIKSSNAGSSFITQNDGGTHTFNYIFFRDELNGWAIGDWGDVFSTSNGGNTWNTGNVAGSTNWHCGDYLPSGTAFIMGVGQMYKSTNDGQSWSILKNFVPRTKFNGMFFHDDLAGTAVGSVGISGQGSSQSGIVQTENGGQTWGVRNQGFSGGWWDVHFSDQNNGTVIGGINFGKTTNGGTNWTYSTIPFNLTGVATWFFGPQVGLVGGEGIFSGACRTIDGGSSFNCQDNTLAKDFFFLNDQLGWAIHEGGSGNVLKTSDGGQNWEYVPTGSFSGFYSVYFIDENKGWLGTGSGSVLRTIDGGETWEQSFPGGGDIVGVHFYDEMIGFCVDFNNNLFKSEDGGESWEFILGDTFTMTTCTEAVFTENYVYTSNWGGNIYRANLGCGSIAEGVITGNTDWCEGEVGIVALNQSSTIASVEWTLPEGWVAEDGGAFLEVIAGDTGGLIGALAFNSCGLSSETLLAVSVTPQVQQPEAITEPDLICSGAEVEFNVPDDAFADSYDWSVPSGWLVAEENNTLTVVPNENSGIISLVVSNECGSSELIFTQVQVQTPPVIEYSLPSDSLCSAEQLELGEANPPGGEFSGEFVLDGVLNLEGAPAGPTLITYTLAAGINCQASETYTLTILENDFELQSLLGPSQICEGGEAGFTFEWMGDLQEFTWSYPSEWEVTETETSINISSAQSSGTVSIAAIGSCGSEQMLSQELVVNGPPDPPVLNSQANLACLNEDLLLEIELPEDVVLGAGASEELNLQINNAGITINSDTPGDYVIAAFASNDCGVSDTSYFELTVFNSVAAEITFEWEVYCNNMDGIIMPDLVPEGGILIGEEVQGNAIDVTNLEGNYVYTYSFDYENGCIAIDEAEIEVTGCFSVDEKESEKWLLYPNPARDYLRISSDSNKVVKTVAIYDGVGRQVQQLQPNSTEVHIDLQTLSSGMYFLRVNDGERSLRLELIR